jgi:hypothetical protein
MGTTAPRAQPLGGADRALHDRSPRHVEPSDRRTHPGLQTIPRPQQPGDIVRVVHIGQRVDGRYQVLVSRIHPSIVHMFDWDAERFSRRFTEFIYSLVRRCSFTSEIVDLLQVTRLGDPISAS